MGLIGRVLQFLRTEVDGEKVADVQLDPGGGANLTAEHFGPAGDDSQPLEGDLAVTVSSAGREHVGGYVDPKNEGQAGPGEKRLYARDANGAVIGVVWLRSDGTVELGLDPTEWAAVASYVMRELDALKATLDDFKTAYDAHIHTTTATVGASATPGVISPTTSTAPAPQTPQDVASTTVKVQP